MTLATSSQCFLVKQNFRYLLKPNQTPFSIYIWRCAASFHACKADEKKLPNSSIFFRFLRMVWQDENGTCLRSNICLPRSPYHRQDWIARRWKVLPKDCAENLRAKRNLETSTQQKINPRRYWPLWLVLLIKREYLVFSHHLNQHRPVFIKTLYVTKTFEVITGR